MSEKKVLIGILVATFLILGGAVMLLGQTSSGTNLEKTAGAKVETSEASFDFKDINYLGGNVEHSFLIKNIGDKELKIANMSTSCMCTTVYLKTAAGKSPGFGMKGHSASSDWTGNLAPGESGEVVAVFDPTAHGPSGVGPIDRIVSLETNDPDRPYVEFSFKGNVLKPS